MLSRVANSLYWMSRYIERAENMTRLLAVNYYTLLDARQIELEAGWRPLVSMTADEALFERYYDSYSPTNVVDFVLWNGSNASSVVSSISLARENARSVREQISREMWEYLNRLYFTVKDANRQAISRELIDFYGQIRDGSHAFQGITNETMTHGEAFQFIQLAKHLERGDKTARILGFHREVGSISTDGDDDPLKLMAMLKSCSAFEPFRKAYASRMRSASAVEYLLVDREFPRAVAYCMDRSLRAVGAISGVDEAAKRLQILSSPQRSIGRLVSELEYLDVSDVLGDRLRTYLADVVSRINRAGEDVASTYFNTQIIMPELHPQQAQQQQ